MEQMAEKNQHAYIVYRDGFCGGRAVIAETKFSVSSVVNYVLRQGMTPEELVKEFSHLSLSQVYDALSFYYDHKWEIDKDIESSSEIETIKEFGNER